MATEILIEEVQPSPATIAVTVESKRKYNLSRWWSRLFFIQSHSVFQSFDECGGVRGVNCRMPTSVNATRIQLSPKLSGRLPNLMRPKLGLVGAFGDRTPVFCSKNHLIKIIGR
jgi:hypothetical protein